MFSFLIVTYNEVMQKSLKDGLRTAFRECRVEVVDNHAKALRDIRTPSNRFDAIVLDLSNRSLATDNGVMCTAVNSHMPHTLLAHIVEGTEEPAVIARHMTQHHNTLSSESFIVSKTDPAWGDTAIKQMQTRLYSQIIADQLDDGLSGSRYSATSRLARLEVDLSEYYGYLTPAVKTRVDRQFESEEPAQGARRLFTLRLPVNAS